MEGLRASSSIGRDTSASRPVNPTGRLNAGRDELPAFSLPQVIARDENGEVVRHYTGDLTHARRLAELWKFLNPRHSVVVTFPARSGYDVAAPGIPPALSMEAP